MQPEKICPRCQYRNNLTTSVCYMCGHQFRTRFNVPDQTQMDMPRDAMHRPRVPTSGPLDNTERAVSMVWTFIGIIFFYLLTAACLGTFLDDMHQRQVINDPSDKSTVYSMFWLLISGSVLSFFTMRFRRLLLSTPGNEDSLTRQRRSGVFAIIASLGIIGLFLLAFDHSREKMKTTNTSLPSYTTQEPDFSLTTPIQEPNPPVQLSPIQGLSSPQSGMQVESSYDRHQNSSSGFLPTENRRASRQPNSTKMKSEPDITGVIIHNELSTQRNTTPAPSSAGGFGGATP